jgi:hypothetical protein
VCHAERETEKEKERRKKKRELNGILVFFSKCQISANTMAPPEITFPVSTLDQRVHYETIDYKEKSRKLVPRDFDLQRDCELLELVQYSCTTPEQQLKRAAASEEGSLRIECFPIVRLFRKYAEQPSITHDYTGSKSLLLTRFEGGW